VASKGTAFYRLHLPAALFVQVVTLLANGCPTTAIVAAFGLDARTVAAWHQRAGAHSACVQVQADELRIKKHGGVVWIAVAVAVAVAVALALALAVAGRRWLGAVVPVSRDGALADRLAQLVRRCAVPGAPPHGPLVWGVDGWVPM
jgi:hypothetical protein